MGWYKRVQARLLTLENAAYNDRVAEYKRSLFGELQGHVVEIGPGAGANLGFLRHGTHWSGVEPNRYLREELAQRAAERGIRAEILAGVAEQLPFPDRSVDAVMCSLVLCSVADPQRALSEIHRVLKPGGRFAFIEHVADPAAGRRARFQDLLAPVWKYMVDGCQPNRRTWETIQDAGFKYVDLRHFEAHVPLMGSHIAGMAFR